MFVVVFLCSLSGCGQSWQGQRCHMMSWPDLRLTWGDRRHCVSRPSPSSLWREGPTCSKDAVVTTLWVLFPDWPKLGHRVKDEEGVRGETGDHRGRDQGEHGHGGDNDGGRGSVHYCSLQCCRDQMCGVTSHTTRHTRFKLMHIE